MLEQYVPVLCPQMPIEANRCPGTDIKDDNVIPFGC